MKYDYYCSLGHHHVIEHRMGESKEGESCTWLEIIDGDYNVCQSPLSREYTATPMLGKMKGRHNE